MGREYVAISEIAVAPEGAGALEEAFGTRFGALAALDEATFRRHVDYCVSLFDQRGFPGQWLEDAWRTMAGVLRDELPAPAAEPALAALAAVTGVGTS